MQKLLLVNTLPEDGIEDMTRLNYLHEPALLNNVRHRFERDHVYTYTGKICIAVNPFNWQASAPTSSTAAPSSATGRSFAAYRPLCRAAATVAPSARGLSHAGEPAAVH